MLKLVLTSILFTLMGFLGGCADQPANRTTSAPLAVADIDTQRFLGLWHEAARAPNRFEHNCVSASAEYGVRPDGLISVRNMCAQADGETRAIVGRARRAGAGHEGKLEVSFFGPFWADYWVLDRAPDYTWSIVGEPSGRYLWVLTRAEAITPAQRADFERRLTALGYDVSKLYWKPV